VTRRAAAALAALLLCAPSLHAANLPAGADLQAAVEAARGGETLRLAPGHYHLRPVAYQDPLCGNCREPVTPVAATHGLLVEGKSIRIVGSSDGESVIHTHAGYGILFEDCPQAVLERVTVTDGVRDPDGNATDAAVVVRNSRLTIRDCRIVGNVGDPEVLDEIVVGIIGIAGREGSRIRAERNVILGNSWDGVALYRGARATLVENRIDGGMPEEGTKHLGGRGVGVGVTWDARARLVRNWVTRYWKGVGVFVDAQARLEGNVIEDMVTWGVALWPASDEGRPSLIASGNVIYRTGACGFTAPRWNPRGHDLGRFVDNAVMETGLDPRYDSPDRYCPQRALALVGEGSGTGRGGASPRPFEVRGTLQCGNREPGVEGPPQAPCAGPAGREAAWLRALCNAVAPFPTRFGRARCSRIR